MALHDPEKIAWLAATGERLRIDAATVEVLERLELAGVDAILLKGPAIARWLYPGGVDRPYIDCDVLVNPADFDAAEEVLRSLGYGGLLADLGMPSWWCKHAAVWQRPGDGPSVDLHRTLIGVQVDIATAWRVLSTDTAEVIVAGRPARVLGLPARAMHVALHAAQHGPGWPTSIADLERALATADDDLWRQAATIAQELRATAAFVAGLRLVPAGNQLVTRLALPDVRSVASELRAGSAPPLALGFEQLAQARGVLARVEIARRKLVPTPAFMRDTDSDAATGRAGLARAYVRRALWLLRRAPAGLWAWYRARSSVSGS